MKLLIPIWGLLCLSAVAAVAQTQPERRVIEVSGSAERSIMPNEFIFKITLTERIEDKRKVTIEQQESALKTELSRLGLDTAKALSIYDISSAYVRQKRVKDVLGSKDYRLKIEDLSRIAQLQDIADRLNVSRLDLIDTTNSDMTRHRREVKIEAVRAAKAKAEYLLAAIGERVGKPVSITEVDEETPSYRLNSANTTSNVFIADGSRGRSADADLSFSETKVRFVINAKFEIE